MPYSTANIEEVMKFYNLGDKTFETDFNTTDKILTSDISPLALNQENYYAIKVDRESCYCAFLLRIKII